MTPSSNSTFSPSSQTFSPTDVVAAHASVQERLAFIRKTYALFFVATLASFAAGAVMLIGFEPLGIPAGGFVWFLRHPLIAIVIYFVGVFAVQGLQRVPVVNLLALLGYAAFTGAYFSLVALASYFVTGGELVTREGQLVLTGGSWSLAGQAFGLTLAAFGGLSMYAFVTRKDFSHWGAALTILLFVAIGVALIAFFMGGFSNPGIELGFCSVIVLLMSAFVLYDTSRIIRSHPVDRPVSAALSLFLDFALLFVYILRILTILQGRR